MFKRNPHTRNIFTAEGRLNRCIDKYNKTLGLINKMEEILKRIENKIDNNIGMGIPIDEINDEIVKKMEAEECVICCDGCRHEFNILDDSIEVKTIEKTENDQIIEETVYICPECGHQNEIELDDDEEDIESTDSENSNDNYSHVEGANVTASGDNSHAEDNTTVSGESTSDDESEVNIESVESSDNVVDLNDIQIPKKIEIKNKKNHKIILNKKVPFKVINDEKIISILNIALSHKSYSETVDMLNDNGIMLTEDGPDSSKGCMLHNGYVAVIQGQETTDCVESFLINTNLIIVPHGNQVNLFNNILRQLDIEKYDDKYKSIGLDGKASIIKLRDGSKAACNFDLNGNNLTIAIVYDIDN